ncbi:hypothetical protein KKF55_03290 [Patescibacteria group bacterium]|nr:hypothetical protein [Patescibacteria group bacterium]
MNTTFSSTGSQKASSGTTSKTGSSTPFDQITQLEAQEKERVQKEISAMEKEMSEVEKAVQEKTFQAEEELKLKAGAELKEYKDGELSAILSQAKADSKKGTVALEDQWSAKENQATQQLVGKMIQDDSPLFQ